MAANTAQQAYEETRNHVELISQMGLLDVWMMFIAQLIQACKDPDNSELIATARFAGKVMIEEKAQTIKKYRLKMRQIIRETFHTRDHIVQQGWRNK
ncbi:hypothetical protein ACSFA3_09435 [Variovorax sp. RHLX14]|uniref:hypothetical protein n=1 Tax=Variovorax sp. RHLX14 TaxID=1259731 RepID=UPI003F47D423